MTSAASMATDIARFFGVWNGSQSRSAAKRRRRSRKSSRRSDGGIEAGSGFVIADSFTSVGRRACVGTAVAVAAHHKREVRKYQERPPRRQQPGHGVETQKMAALKNLQCRNEVGIRRRDVDQEDPCCKADRRDAR